MKFFGLILALALAILLVVSPAMGQGMPELDKIKGKIPMDKLPPGVPKPPM